MVQLKRNMNKLYKIEQETVNTINHLQGGLFLSSCFTMSSGRQNFHDEFDKIL
jgi:hypothetical protein